MDTVLTEFDKRIRDTNVALSDARNRLDQAKGDIQALANRVMTLEECRRIYVEQTGITQGPR